MFPLLLSAEGRRAVWEHHRGYFHQTLDFQRVWAFCKKTLAFLSQQRATFSLLTELSGTAEMCVGETKSIRELVEGWWELQKNTMCRSELKADLEQSGVMVSTRNIRRTPNQDGLNERQLRWTPLLKDRIPRLDWSVLKQAPDKLQSLRQNVWTGDTEIELCRQAEKYTLPTVKHHGSVMLWDCFCCLWWKETYSVLNESRNQRITGAFLQQNGLPSERVESKIKGPPKHKKYGWTFLKTIHQ